MSYWRGLGTEEDNESMPAPSASFLQQHLQRQVAIISESPARLLGTREFRCEEFSGHFLLFYLSIFWAVVRNKQVSARALSSLCSLWEMKLKSPEGFTLDRGLEGWGCIVGPLQTCMVVNRCITKGFLHPCLICLSLTYTFTKARGVETTNWWQVF